MLVSRVQEILATAVQVSQPEALRGQDVVTKLYDGNNYYTMASTITFPFDTWAIDRVEILKGPASVLYGQGGVAGAYNVVPKSVSYTHLTLPTICSV